MKIVIEAKAIGYIPCGVREYTLQVCSRLVKRHPEDMDLTFIVPPGYHGCFGTDAGYIEAGALKSALLRRLPMVKADIFHALHQICKVKKLPGARHTLLTIHDINFEHTKTGRSYRHARRRFESRLHEATHLAYISRFAQADVEKHYKPWQPSKVIYNGVTPPDPAVQKRPEGVPDGPFLLHLSSLDKYKNARLLVEMMKYLPDMHLVMAGNIKDTELKQLVRPGGNVTLTGAVSDEEKTWLYGHCTAFLFPSKAEGFGLPPLEAMHMGKPVFLSTATSLPEVGGDAAYYWPELDAERMASVLTEKLALPYDPDVLKAHAASFSWDATADAYLRYYREIGSSNSTFACESQG